MSDIDRYLARLRSPNKDARYEACEELRVAENIPPEAFTALELAAKDEDALVADAARRALLTHRPPPARGQQDFATANQEHAPLRCPNCGRYEIRIDRRSADELKHDAFLKRLGGSFLAWLGALLLIFLQFGSGDQFDLRVFFVVALLGLALMLVVIIRAYRQVYDASSARPYPAAQNACNACGHQWTTDASQSASAHQNGEIGVSSGKRPPETTERSEATEYVDPAFRRLLRWSTLLSALGIAVLAVLSLYVFLRPSQPDPTSHQLKSVGPLASAVFPADVNLDILGSGKVVAFKKDDLMSYSDAVAIYRHNPWELIRYAEGLITIAVTRSDTRAQADASFDKQCNARDYPTTTSQFDGGRACVSSVKATVRDDWGSPLSYDSYLVLQKDTLVIDIRQDESSVNNSILREEVVKFLADRLPELARQLEQTANRPLKAAVFPPTPNDVWTSPTDGAEYVFVPGGPFAMGASGDDDAWDEEKPQHTVDVDDFWIMRTEVTNAQYHLCVEVGACEPPQIQDFQWDLPGVANLPVTGVTWNQAMAYAQWMGGRLPTEAEWEKACRGTDGRRYPWGDTYPIDYDQPTAPGRSPVGEAYRTISEADGLVIAVEWPIAVASEPLDISPFGVMDMAHNAAEWTTTIWGASYPYRADDGRESLDNSPSVERVIRGAWGGEPWHAATVAAQSGPTMAPPVSSIP